MAERVLHPMRIRRLQVAKVADLSPSLRRVWLAGDLADFPYGHFSPGDHVRLILPENGELVLPQVVDNRVVRVPGIGPTRDYTPRTVDADGLVIDMVTSHDGPAARWAAAAQVGDEIGVGGPRASVLMPADREHYVVVADATALPAAARWVEGAPAAARLTLLLHAPGNEHYLDEVDRSRVGAHWCATEAEVLDRLRDLDLTSAFVWAAGEAQWMVQVREVLSERHVRRPDRKVVGYWRRGEAGFDHHTDLG
ncbi:MAG: siderophore-interacting protein [Actinomycetia bacterium]|nr:siderophore-interacting protein [Actinomycetes bacterium]